MIGSVLLFAMQTMQTLDNRKQPTVPATEFRCNFVRAKNGEMPPEQFDLYGVIPIAPEGRQPNDQFPLTLGSATGSELAGGAMVNPIRSSDWFRDYQLFRRVGTASYVINLKLRRDGQSVAYSTVFDPAWAEPKDGSEGEPYRYDAVGNCIARFSIDEQKP